MQTMTSRKFIVFFFKVVALVTGRIVRIIDDSIYAAGAQNQGALCYADDAILLVNSPRSY